MHHTTEYGWDAYYTCTKCNYNGKQLIAPTGHSVIAYVDKNDATYKCANCSLRYQVGDSFQKGGIMTMTNHYGYSSVDGNSAKLYYDYRFIRADKILPMYVLKGLTARLKHFNDRTFNKYGSSKSTLLIESGRMDGDKKESKYFLQSKKIYSRRYTTDCLSAIFNQYADKNTIGIEDLPEYLTELGTDEENLLQNSFFQSETHHYN